MLFDCQQSQVDHAPGAPRYEGQLYNPAEYQPQQVPQTQPVPQHQRQSTDQVAIIFIVYCVHVVVIVVVYYSGDCVLSQVEFAVMVTLTEGCLALYPELSL